MGVLNHRKSICAWIGLIGSSLLGSGLLGLDLPMADAADLNNVRVVQQENTPPQVILDLNAPAADLKIDSSNPKGFALSFTGRIAAGLADRKRAITGTPAMKQIAWNARGSRVTVWIPKTPAAGSINVLPLADPNRLMIRVPERVAVVKIPPLPKAPVPAVSSLRQTVAPGVTHQHLHLSGARGPLNINIIDIDTTRSDITVEPVLASSVDLHAKARVTRMVQSHNAIAGINASYFKPDKGTVLGTVILNRELISGPLYNRVSLGITTDRHLRMERLSLKGSLTADNGEILTIDNVNQPRLDKHQALLYSPRWGKMSPPTPAGHVQVQIRGGEVIATGNDRMPVPADGLVLIAPQDTAAGHLLPGNKVNLRLYTVPDWTNVAYAVSGGPFLVHDSKIFVDSKQQAFRSGAFLRPAPRTAVGITASNHLLMVTVDGRQDAISTGMTLSEMGALMRRLGAVEAMNFDGGSSTQMVLKGRLVNSPTVTGGAAVSSALIVRSLAPLPAEVIGDSSNGQPFHN